MSLSVKDVLQITGGRIVSAPQGTESVRVERPAPLGGSKPGDLAFFFSRDYESELPLARPGILITGEPFVKPLEAAKLPFWGRSTVIACEDPYLALALLSEKFAAFLSTVSHLNDRKKGLSPSEIHPSAVVHPLAKIGEGARIGPNCVVEDGAVIGARTVLYPGCYIGPKVIVGEDCVFFPHVVLYEWTVVGNRARIHANTTLGSDGFGYAPIRREGEAGSSGGVVVGHQKIYHLGRVVVGDDVEIGACCSLDRSTFGDTVIANHVKLDNQVHIGHNAQVDEGAAICGGTCLAGRAHVGKYAYVGGLTGITNGVYVGDGAQVGAVALVTKDVAPGATAVGNPQREYREHFRAHAALNKLISSRSKSGKGNRDV